jgi:hypothetical protein
MNQHGATTHVAPQKPCCFPSTEISCCQRISYATSVTHVTVQCSHSRDYESPLPVGMQRSLVWYNIICVLEESAASISGINNPINNEEAPLCPTRSPQSALPQKDIRVGILSEITCYDRETKRQSRECHMANSPRPKKTRVSKSKTNRCSLVFWTVRRSSTRN